MKSSARGIPPPQLVESLPYPAARSLQQVVSVFLMKDKTVYECLPQ